MLLRPVQLTDRAAVLNVEALSTPRLRYLPVVFEDFTADASGEFMLLEEQDEVLACAKWTSLPDHSAWLETLRVIPEAQGRGLGKRLYQRFFEIARHKGVRTMRMYTGLDNLVSKGLAGHFGFALEETFMGLSRLVAAEPQEQEPPRQISDPAEARALLLPLRAHWGDFVVMNRTFYPLSPQLCDFLAQRGMIYAVGKDVLVLGARFSPDQALHLGLWAGDLPRCLAWAEGIARQQGSARLSCLLPRRLTEQVKALRAQGFQEDAGQYIVMRVDL